MEDFFIDNLGDENFDKLVDTAVKEQDFDCRKSGDISKCQVLDLFEELSVNLTGEKINFKTLKENKLDNTYLISSYKSKNEEGKKSLSHVDKLLEKSVINKGFEKRLFAPSEKSKKVLKLKRKKLKEKTKGKDWYNIPATEVTEEIKTDFELLKMRSVLDRKHMYKKNDITHMPKYFQVGRVIESPADFYAGRVPKSQRKKTMIDELLDDAEFKNYQKKKFKEIMDENRKKKHGKKNLGGNKKQKEKFNK